MAQINLDEEDILFLESWYTPKDFSECMFHDWDNFTAYKKGKFGELRLYQFSMISDEPMIDFEMTAEHHGMGRKEEFQMRKMVGDLYCFGARKFGKCSDENSLCSLSDGTRVKFKDLVGKQAEVVSFNQDTWKLENSTASFFDNGIRNCLNFKLQSGKEDTVTENHPLLTQRGWLKASEITENDFLATPREYANLGKVIPEPNLPTLLGYLLGDGGCTNGSVNFTNIDSEIISEIYFLADFYDCKLHKTDITYGFSKKEKGRNKNKVYELVLRHGLNKLAKNKEMPNEVFSWDNQSIALLLNRLYACDGSVYKNNTVNITLASEKLIKDIQHLLIRFGISSKIYYKAVKLNGKVFDAWVLAVNSYVDAKSFMTKIGIKTKDFKFDMNKNALTKTNVIPNSFYYNIESELCGYKKLLKTRNFKRYNVSTEKWQKLATIIGSEKIKKIAFSDIKWDKIKEIVRVRDIRTVAVSVPKNNTYISNDIISHNTKITQELELLHHAITSDEGNKIAFSSVDKVHLDKVLNPMKTALVNHKILKKFLRRAKGAPDYYFELKNNVVINSINFNIGSANPGQQWFGSHVYRVYVEEACFSGRARIACINSKGKRETLRLSELVNEDKWKSLKALSYNFNTEKMEPKSIIKPFKKTVKNYSYYRLEVCSKDKNKKRVLEASQKQKFWTSEGYKYVTELKVGDLVYSLDYLGLSDIQKQITVGTLLGDAWLNRRDENCTPNLGFCHGKGQAEYLKYKQEVFVNIFRCNYRRTQEVVYDFKDTSYGGSVSKIASNACIDLEEFADFKANKKINMDLMEKYFSAISFAFWIMDDGSLGFANGKTFFGKKYLSLHTEGFSKDCCIELVNFLNKKYSLTGKILEVSNKKYPIIFFDDKSTRKVVDIVKQYVHPIFYYKLYHRSELCNFIYKKITPEFTDLGIHVKDLLLPSKILSIRPVSVKSWTMYDIEVEDNHNFFANGILVHNSLETEEVYDKRKDALSEVGAVFRCGGMTDFTPFSPPGKAFYKLENQKHVLNYPQFVNPFFDEQENLDRIEEYGGKTTIGYKVFVKGEVVEDGVTALDMKRIRENCYILNKQGKFLKKITTFEVTKENFKFWKNLIIVRRPENAERIWISSDVGKRVTEIIVHSEVDGKYEYIYNAVLLNLTQQEVEIIFEHMIRVLNANYIAIDCGDGEGRGIYSGFELKFPKERLVYYDGSMKIQVGYEYEETIEGEKEIILDRNGDPEYKHEIMADWSVKRLKDLLYGGEILIPEDLKFDRQFSGVIETAMNGKIKYKCICTQGDHLFDAWKVFAIAQFTKSEFAHDLQEDLSNWGSGASN